MQRENKKILTAVILVILLAITGYIYYRNRFVSEPNPAPQSGNLEFHGPTTPPYVEGPTGPPPSTMDKQ